MPLDLPDLSQLRESKLVANDEQRLRKAVDHVFETLDDSGIRIFVESLSELVSRVLSHGVEGLPPEARREFRELLGDKSMRPATLEPVLQEIKASLLSQPLVSTEVALTRARAKHRRDNFRYEPDDALSWRGLAKGLVLTVVILVAAFAGVYFALLVLQTVFRDVPTSYAVGVVRNAGEAGLRRDGFKQLGLRE